MERISVSPQLLSWARERARLDAAALAQRFPKLSAWEAGELLPTLRQLQDYAHATHAPFGYFFLPEPPVEPVPIPDFRTLSDRAVTRPSPDLLDTVYACQERQSWYREHAQVSGLAQLAFVGSLTRDMPPTRAAEHIRDALGFSVEARRSCANWSEALRQFIAQAEGLGVLVMVNGVVLSNNTRKLDPQEFRGFVLSDPWAPLVFINGADSKAAQMFTLAHELAHLWLGQTALSDASGDHEGGHAVESWCNQVAAELLVPMAVFMAELHEHEPLQDTLSRLARHFKVSTLVVLRRLHDAGQLDRQDFFAAYHEELIRIQALDTRQSGGGSFYNTTLARVGKRYARALVESTLEGRTLYRDAFRMLGISKTATFHELGRTLGYPL